MSDILDRAYEVHARACAKYPLRWPWQAGIAEPFGRPATMPDYRWRVSWDVMQQLTAAAPPAWSFDDHGQVVNNPKTAEGADKQLFGWPIDVDRDAPDDTMELLRADPHDLGQQVTTRTALGSPLPSLEDAAREALDAWNEDPTGGSDYRTLAAMDALRAVLERLD